MPLHWFDRDYFYTEALELNGQDSTPSPILGKWRHGSLFGPDPIEVNGSRPVTTRLQCPGEIRAATEYNGTVVFWAEQPE